MKKRGACGTYAASRPRNARGARRSKCGNSARAAQWRGAGGRSARPAFRARRLSFLQGEVRLRGARDAIRAQVPHDTRRSPRVRARFSLPASAAVRTTAPDTHRSLPFDVRSDRPTAPNTPARAKRGAARTSASDSRRSLPFRAAKPPAPSAAHSARRGDTSARPPRSRARDTAARRSYSARAAYKDSRSSDGSRNHSGRRPTGAPRRGTTAPDTTAHTDRDTRPRRGNRQNTHPDRTAAPNTSADRSGDTLRSARPDTAADRDRARCAKPSAADHSPRKRRNTTARGKRRSPPRKFGKPRPRGANDTDRPSRSARGRHRGRHGAAHRRCARRGRCGRYIDKFLLANRCSILVTLLLVCGGNDRFHPS